MNGFQVIRNGQCIGTRHDRMSAMLAMNRAAWEEMVSVRRRRYAMDMKAGVCVVSNGDGSLVAEYRIVEVVPA